MFTKSLYSYSTNSSSKATALGNLGVLAGPNTFVFGDNGQDSKEAEQFSITIPESEELKNMWLLNTGDSLVWLV
jgi:hypothetical protein